MNKIVAYYSIIIVAIAIIMCLFDNNGDTDTLLGGIIFIPVFYSLWESISEMRISEKRTEIEEKMKEEEKIREEIRKEMKEEKEPA